MPAFHDLWLFVLAGLLLNLTPGPDLAYIAARSAAGGFRQGVAATLGITTGCVVHTLAAAAGLSVLLATSATAFAVVKWVGAAYLAWLGARMLWTARRALPDESGAALLAASELRIFREGVLINVLNPKVALFFLAFLPQFVDASSPSAQLAFLMLGTLFNVNSLFVNLPVAWLAAHATRRGRASPRLVRLIRSALGALFVVLAVRLAVAERT
jgi:threonine/homoserine/homoserine lactone efflux protein